MFMTNHAVGIWTCCIQGMTIPSHEETDSRDKLKQSEGQSCD